MAVLYIITRHWRRPARISVSVYSPGQAAASQAQSPSPGGCRPCIIAPPPHILISFCQVFLYYHSWKKEDDLEPLLHVNQLFPLPPPPTSPCLHMCTQHQSLFYFVYRTQYSHAVLLKIV